MTTTAEKPMKFGVSTVICTTATSRWARARSRSTAQLRDEWGFFRDRRPDAYGALVAP